MIKTIERRICDICQKEVERFAGSLDFKYSDSDYNGCWFPVKFEYKQVCIDCCRKLDKVIRQVIRGE